MMIDPPDNKCRYCGIECGSRMFMTWEFGNSGYTYKCNGRSKHSKYHKDACKLRAETAKREREEEEQRRNELEKLRKEGKIPCVKSAHKT